MTLLPEELLPYKDTIIECLDKMIAMPDRQELLPECRPGDPTQPFRDHPFYGICGYLSYYVTQRRIGFYHDEWPLLNGRSIYRLVLEWIEGHPSFIHIQPHYMSPLRRNLAQAIRDSVYHDTRLPTRQHPCQTEGQTDPTD